MNSRSLGIALLVSGLTAVAADTVRAGSIPEMIEASSLIVVGRVDAVQSQPASPSGPASVVISANRVLKGSAQGQVVVQLDQSNPDYGSVRPQQYGMFFLRQSARGGLSYTPTDPYTPALIASPISPKGFGSSDALTGVARELASVLTTPPERLVGSGDPAAAQLSYSEAAAALQDLPLQAGGPALQAVANSNGSPGRVWAVASLLSLDNGPGSDIRQSQYLDLVKSFLLKPDPNLAFTVSLVANAVQANVKSPAAIPTLTALLGSPAVSVRRAAASALSDIATKQVIAPLANIALKDADQNVRYYAVLGLAEATGVTKSPTMPSFKQNEVAMLGFWRNWAKANVN